MACKEKREAAPQPLADTTAAVQPADSIPRPQIAIDTVPLPEQNGATMATEITEESNGPSPIEDPGLASDFPGLDLRTKIDRYCDGMYDLSCRYAGMARVEWIDHTVRTIVQKDSADTAANAIQGKYLAFEESAYKWIQSYKDALASGSGDSTHRPAMLSGASFDDSLFSAKLPKVQPSNFFQEKAFFFLGAGPHLNQQLGTDDSVVHRDLAGRSELRYCNDITHNTSLIMDMVRSVPEFPVRTLEGGPISFGHHEDYVIFEKSVKGIGFLTHVMQRNLPVYFITTKGIVAARLAKVTDKLFESNQGCVSERPDVCFGVSSKPKGEILGVYISYEPISLTQCKVTRKRQMWTVDLTGDDVPELAGVSSSYESVAGTITHVIWYANIQGAWIPVDAGETPDCT